MTLPPEHSQAQEHSDQFVFADLQPEHPTHPVHPEHPEHPDVPTPPEHEHHEVQLPDAAIDHMSDSAHLHIPDWIIDV
jgi:hypothetical protein